MTKCILIVKTEEIASNPIKTYYLVFSGDSVAEVYKRVEDNTIAELRDIGQPFVFDSEMHSFSQNNSLHKTSFLVNEIELEIPLTSLQICGIHDIAATIAKGANFFGETEDLTEVERDYLIHILEKTYNIIIDLENGTEDRSNART